MRVAALISGGKDSCYNMMKCVEAGHEIVSLINLHPSVEGEVDSYMYQTTGQEIIPLFAEAADIPLYRRCIRGTPITTSFDYHHDNPNDEVEDLFAVVEEVKAKEEIEAVSVGAIFSEYQRNRVVDVCSRLGLKVLALLWKRDQELLLDEMIKGGVEAIIIKVASLGLDQRHLGLTLQEVRPHLMKLNSRFGSNVCGEGGEFETIVADCPLFKHHKIKIHQSEVVEHSKDAWYLRIKEASLVEK